MAWREFPALGFDPAPGDPAALAGAARSVDGAGRVFADASGNVNRLNSSGWTGEAADAFRGQLKDLPRDLDLAARSHQTAARALSDYGSGLEARQRRADELEARAAELRRLQTAAIGEVNRIAAQRAPEGSPELAQLRSQYTSARSRSDTLAGELAQVIADARRLHSEHQFAAQSAAGTIRSVADAPYKEPGWLSRAWDSVKNWIKDNADVLTQISTVLKGVSAVLGVLSLVPGLQFLAPFALAAGGIALAIDVAVKAATGRGSWASIGLDAALTVMPWSRVGSLVRRAPGAARALDGAGDLVSRAGGGRSVGHARDAPEVPASVVTTETRASQPVAARDATRAWEEFLGEGPYTNVHPRTGHPDPDRIVSADGTRSIRLGPHEMNSSPTRFHYHEERWRFDPGSNTWFVENVMRRVPLPKGPQ